MVPICNDAVMVAPIAQGIAEPSTQALSFKHLIHIQHFSIIDELILSFTRLLRVMLRVSSPFVVHLLVCGGGGTAYICLSIFFFKERKVFLLK